MKTFMILLATLSFNTFADDGLEAKFRRECDKGSSNPTYYPDMQFDLKREEDYCVQMKLKTAKTGIKPVVKKPKSAAEITEYRNQTKRDCYKGSRNSTNYYDQHVALVEQEQECEQAKLAEVGLSPVAKPQAPTGCQVNEGVSIQCPEGTYKLQPNDLANINDAMGSKDVSTTRSPAKSSLKSSTAK